MAQSAGHAPYILLCGYEQSRGGMPEAVEGNQRELILVRSIVPLQDLDHGLIWSGIIHLLSIVLDEKPVSTLPVITNRHPILNSINLHGLKPLGEKNRDGDDSV